MDSPSHRDLQHSATNRIFDRLCSALRVMAATPSWAFMLSIGLFWYLQYAYMSVTFAPTFFPASNDFMSLALHLQDIDKWGAPLRDGNTAQFRGVGYPFYLLLVSLGSLNISLIQTANYVLTLTAYLLSYGLFARLFGRLRAAVIVCVIAATFTPLAFAATILSEHLIVSMLLMIAPLCVLSVTRPDMKYRISLAALLIALAAVKSIFAPMLILFLALWTVEWFFVGLRRRARRYAPLMCASIVGLVLIAPINSAFMPNYNSGMYVFGLLNSLVFGANTKSNDLAEIYEPLFKHGLLTEADALDTWKIVVEKAREVGTVDASLANASAQDARKLLFEEPTLETYWQLKWKILRGINNEKEANEFARKLYFSYLTRHPVRFFANVAASWLAFVRGEALDFRYGLDDSSIYRNEAGLRVYRTGRESTKRFIKEWRRKGILFDGWRGRSTPLGIRIDVNGIIEGSTKVLYTSNLMLALMWFVATIGGFALALRGRIRLDEQWWRQMSAAFALQAGFFGIALGTVLFHPPLGRYFLPLAPIVMAASIQSFISIRMTFQRILAIIRIAR